MTTASTRLDILFPPGRIVQGDPAKPQDKDNSGAPLIYKRGPKQGQARINYFFAIAIPKLPGHTHWSQTEWGGKIWAHGHALWQSIADRATGALPDTFAWKIEDGDSVKPNTVGRKNADTEGMPGHWIVNMSSSYAPRAFDAQLMPIELTAIKRGYWVEASGNVDSNNEPSKAGMYVNHDLLVLRGIDKEITSRPDPRKLGMGTAALPAGVTMTPPGSALAPPPAGRATLPPLPAAPAPLPTAVAPLPAAPAPLPIAVTPHPGILPPGAIAPPPPAPGVTWLGPPGQYEAYKAAGWTDDALRQNKLLA